MRIKYAPVAKKKLLEGPGTGPGRAIRPNNWRSGPDLFRHELHYAFIKHKAQAKYRREEYSLTIDDWYSLWDLDSWLKRGRNKTSICLAQIDPKGGWHIDNVELISRTEHLKNRRINAEQGI